MFEELERINRRPKPFEFYTAADLWTDEHRSRKMLAFHLNESVDISSRNRLFIDRSVEWIASHFNSGEGCRVIDFGCGPGLYTSRLARLEAAVTGIDFSKNSIDYARQRAAKEGLDINYVNQNYLAFDTKEKFDLILMIMCDFCALSPVQRKTMLEKFHGMLAPGGSVLLDVYSLTAFAQRQEAASYEENQLNGFWSPNKYYGFLNTFIYEQEKVSLDQYTIVEPGKTSRVYNWLQYFSTEDLEKELAAAGFSVQELYADVAGKSYHENSHEFAVVAGKA